MKVLLTRLEARLRQMSPLTLTGVGMLYVLLVAVADSVCPAPMTFPLFYLLGVALAGWWSGSRRTVLVISLASAIALALQELLRARTPPPLMGAWNVATRFAVFLGTGWLTVELSRLTRNLQSLVAGRTAQWKAEAEQHKETSVRLAEAVERFEQLVRSIKEVFWLADASNGQIVYVSPACKDIWGLDCQELYRKPAAWLAAVHPEDRDRIRQRTLIAPAGSGYDDECRVLRPDGEVRWVRIRAFPVCHQRGEVYRVAGLTEDITERKQTQATLQTQAAILEHLEEAVVVTNEQGTIVQVNPAAEWIWGYQRKEMLGQPADMFSALPEPDKTAKMQEVLAALHNTGSWRGTFQNRRKDGTEIFCDAVMNRLEVHGRTLYVAIEQDVTERRQAHEALRQSEESLRAFLNAVPEPAFLLDRQGTIVVGNQVLARNLGLGEGDPTGKNAFDLLPLGVAASRKVIIDQVIETGKAVRFEDVRDGRHFMNWASPALDEAGKVARVAVFGLDITERKRAESTREAFLLLGAKLSTARTPVEAAQAVYAIADLLWKWDCGALDICLQGSERVENILAWDLLGGQRRTVIPPSHLQALSPRSHRIMRQGAELILRQPGQTLESDFIPIGDTSRLSASLMCVPLRREGQPVGVLSIQSYTPNAYTQDDLRTLQALADYCGGALERLRLEELARAREEQNRRILSMALDGFCVVDFGTDAGGAIIDVNEAYCQMTGYSREEILRMRIADLEPAESVADHFRSVQRADAERFETRHRRKDGQEIDVELSVSFLGGSQARVFGFARDVTERNRAAQALAQREELYRSLFDLSPDGILLEDTNGNILDANQALCRSFGYGREEVLRRNVRGFVPPDGVAEVEAHLAALCAGQILEHEVLNLRKNGERFLMRLTEKPLTLPDGRRGILVVARDVTASRRAEETREAFLFLGAKLNTARTPVEAARAVYATADLLWCWDSASLDLYSPESDVLQPVLNCDVIEGQRREVPPTQSSRTPSPRMRRIIERGAELILEDRPQPMAEFVTFGDTSRLSASMMYVPVRREDQVIGVMSIHSYAPHAYTEEDVRTLQALADHCGGAVERIRARQSLQEAHDRLELRVQERTAALEAANAALRESEARLRLALDASNAGTWSWDAATEHSTWDERFQEQYGLEPGLRMTTETWLGQVCPTDRERLGARIEALLRLGGGDVWNEEFRVLHPVKGERWMGGLGRVERDQEGRAVRVSGINLDITERKQAEEAQRSQLAYIESIYQNAPVGLCVLDLNCRYVRINDRLAALNGLPVQEHLGRTLREVLPYVGEAAEAICRQVIATGEPMLNIESQGLTVAQPGVVRVALTHWAPLKGADGRVTGVSVVIEEITERERMEQALREAHDRLEERVRERTVELEKANAALQVSEERYRSLVNNLNVGVYRSRPGGQFLSANPALAQIHGYDSMGEFMKVRAPDLFHDVADRDQYLSQLKQKGTLLNYELRLKKRDGTPIYGLVNATAHRGTDGEVEWIDGVLEDVTQRKQAEEARSASEERYRALAESSPDAIFILDQDTRVEYVNTTTAALWQRAPAELVGRKQSELYPPEVARLHAQIVQEVFATGHPAHREELQAYPLGPRWVNISLVPLFGEDGTIRSVMGVSRDITERKRAERQLAETLDLNQKMIAASALGIAAYRASGECVFANEALARILGASLSELRQDHFRRLESWRASGLLAAAEVVLNQQKARSVEVHTLTTFGMTVWLDCHLAPFTSNGEPHLLALILDITKRKQAEAALKQAERLQRAILDNIPDPAWLKGVDGRFLACNRAMAQFYGRPVEAIVGKTVLECIPTEAVRITQEDKAILATGRTIVVEAPVTDAMGRVRWMESVKAPLLDEREEVIGITGIARDLTDRHELQRQILEISDREQARIGQDIHDELCQQLVSLAFDANALRRELGTPRRRAAGKAQRIADGLDRAITEARQLSRGLFPVRLEREGLEPALEGLAKATAARFKIRCGFSRKGEVVVEDPVVATHLYRIAQEAVNNAVRHSLARRVAIRLRGRAGEIDLTIADNGKGLAKTVGRTTTGMGLHIMDYRARTIGGTLHIGPGRRGGTVVSCCIPPARH